MYKTNLLNEKDLTMTLDELNEQIKSAMKSGDSVARDTYRLVLGEVKNLEISEKRDATESDVVNMTKRVLKQTSETLEASEKTDNVERTEKLKAQVQILEGMLPEQLEGDALKARIDEICLSIDNPTKKNIGQIMGQLTKETNGNFDKAFAGQYLNKVL